MIRLVSGLVMAVAFFALVWFGSSLHFFLFTEAAVIVCLLEMFSMFKKGDMPAHPVAGVLTGILLTGAIVKLADADLVIGVAGITVIAVITVAVFRQGPESPASASNTLFAVFFAALPLACLALIRDMPYGREYVIMLVASTAVSDSLAFYTGRAFGKRPLAPKLSPKKTVEGFIGGIAGAMIGATGAMYIFIPELGAVNAAILGVMSGTLGPVGDLAESAIKRKTGVKDSGSFIPGHGGALDRLDSLLFASVAFYVYLVVLSYLYL